MEFLNTKTTLTNINNVLKIIVEYIQSIIYTYVDNGSILSVTTGSNASIILDISRTDSINSTVTDNLYIDWGSYTTVSDGYSVIPVTLDNSSTITITDTKQVSNNIGTYTIYLTGIIEDTLTLVIT